VSAQPLSYHLQNLQCSPVIASCHRAPSSSNNTVSPAFTLPSSSLWRYYLSFSIQACSRSIFDP